MPGEHNPLLWENQDFLIRTPRNPHFPYSEGVHLVVSPKNEIGCAWENPELAAETFMIAAKACAFMKEQGIAEWFNIQANGNWGLLPGSQPFFHLHVYSRNKTERWAKPVILPEAPGTYQNEVMPKEEQQLLIEAFRTL